MAGSWRDVAEVIVELGLRGTAVGGLVWDVGHWDVDNWSGLEPQWAALEGCEVEKLQVRRGRASGRGRHSAGSCEVQLVWPSSGDRWSFRSSSPVQLGQELRIRAFVPEATSDPVPIFRGMVRSVTDAWRRPGPFRLVVRMVDRFAELGAVDLPEQASAAGLGDLTHERILRILELAEVPVERARMGTDEHDSGEVEHQSSTFARNLLEEAWASVESEGGSDLIVDREGFYAFKRSRWWAPHATVGAHPRWNATRATWTNQSSDELYSYCPLTPGGWNTGRDLDDVINRASLARAGGTAQVAADTDSILLYGMRTYQRFDLTNRFDADVLASAELIVDELGTRTDRIETIKSELDPAWAPDELLRWIDVELGDQHGVRWADDEGELAGVVHVQGIQHTITPAHWQLELQAWAYAGNELVPAVEVFRWGVTAWGEQVWG